MRVDRAARRVLRPSRTSRRRRRTPLARRLRSQTMRVPPLSLVLLGCAAYGAGCQRDAWRHHQSVWVLAAHRPAGIILGLAVAVGDCLLDALERLADRRDRL